MKKSIRWGGAFATALIALGCAAAPIVLAEPQADTYGAAAVDVSGPWTSYWGGSQVCNLQLQQNGASVTGGYTTTGAPPGSVAGTLDVDNVLTGSWSDQGGGRGRMILRFSGDGRSFQGTWGSGDSATDGGSWNGSR